MKVREVASEFGEITDGEVRLVLLRDDPGDPKACLVPSLLFAVCGRDGTEFGLCELRIGHNERTYYGGNIGYRIKKIHQGHHYAEKACRLLLGVARQHGMKYVLITCNPDNGPSVRTCERLGAKLLETAELGPDNEWRMNRGDTQKRIYRLDL